MAEPLLESINTDIETLLSRVHYIRCQSPEKLECAVLYKLEPFLDLNPNVRLVVLDSIAFQVRYGYDNDFKQRTNLLSLIGDVLRRLATKRSISVSNTALFDDRNINVQRSAGCHYEPSHMQIG